MTRRSTLTRSLHDLGLAGWFGSVLLTAVSANRAVGDARDPDDVARVTNGLWRRWRPANAALVAMHLVGGFGVLLSNRGRLAHQRGVGTATIAKTAVTLAAAGTSAYAAVLGERIDDAGTVPMQDATTPTGATPDDVAGAMRQLAVLQWAIPALTGVVIVLGALQGEQQRPMSVVAGTLDRLNPTT